MPDLKVLRSRADREAQAEPQPQAAIARNVLRMQLAEGRIAEIALPMDLNEIEALQILGALPQWILAARADYLSKTAGGRLVLPS